jgi:putative sterol carrier protein
MGVTWEIIRRRSMATVDECRDALHQLAARMDANAEAAGKVDLDRPLACSISDLGVAFHGQLVGGRLLDLTDGDNPKAKIRLTATSDDLVALIDGKLDLARAFMSGQIKISANPFDLLKLRKLM